MTARRNLCVQLEVASGELSGFDSETPDLVFAIVLHGILRRYQELVIL